MIQQNISLKAYNTFGIEVNTRFFLEYSSPQDIMQWINSSDYDPLMPFFILGGGSNVLFFEDFQGLIIHPVNQDIEVLNENTDEVLVKVGAGMEWDAWVEYTVNNGWGGLENLSNIPGTVGASPVQNIGAYGVEAKDCIESVEVCDLANGELTSLTNKDCDFGYRSSAFKKNLRNRFVVNSVVFRLHKNPDFKLHYGSVKAEVEQLGELTLANIRQAIVNIRNSKLPNHKELGNAGSFFKNPVIPSYQAERLKLIFEELVTYPAENDMTKVAAGWLIEKVGLKGYKSENQKAGVHKDQALVIVNYGNASAKDIEEVAQTVQKAVFEKFSICLEPEVLFIEGK